MKKIYKEVISIKGEQVIALPNGACILTAEIQNGALCIWYLFDDNNKEKIMRLLKIYGTGQDIDYGQDLHYIATFQSVSGAFVGHLFESIEINDLR